MMPFPTNIENPTEKRQQINSPQFRSGPEQQQFQQQQFQQQQAHYTELLRAESTGATFASTALAPSVHVATPSRKRRAGVCDGFEWPSNTVRMRSSFPSSALIPQAPFMDTPMICSPKRMTGQQQQQQQQQQKYKPMLNTTSNVKPAIVHSSAGMQAAFLNPTPSRGCFCFVRTLTGTMLRVEAPDEAGVVCLTVGMVKDFIEEQALMSCAPREGLMLLWGKRVMGQCDNAEAVPSGAVLHLIAQFGG